MWGWERIGGGCGGITDLICIKTPSVQCHSHHLGPCERKSGGEREREEGGEGEHEEWRDGKKKERNPSVVL